MVEANPDHGGAMYGRRRTESGSKSELGTYFERFESKPPPDATLSGREWSAFHMVALALADTAKAEGRGNAGRRITSRCSCVRCRTSNVVTFPVPVTASHAQAA